MGEATVHLDAARVAPVVPPSAALAVVAGQTGRIATTPRGEPADDFVALYEQHYPRLVRSLEISGANAATAEDVAQEAFARTLGHWRRVRRGESPAGYVYRVAFRLARRAPSGVRIDGSSTAADDDTAPDDAGDVAALVSLVTSVDAVIRAMPPARRACAVLCLVVEMSPKEAGKALGIAESTVRKQTERARSDLRAALGP